MSAMPRGIKYRGLTGNNQPSIIVSTDKRKGIGGKSHMCKSIVYAPDRVGIDRALIETDLAFTAVKRAVFDENGNEIPNSHRIVRHDTGGLLAVNKGGRYNVLNHFEAARHGLGNLFDDPDGDIISSVLNLYKGRN